VVVVVVVVVVVCEIFVVTSVVRFLDRVVD
jgi:hypothetical protein